MITITLVILQGAWADARAAAAKLGQETDLDDEATLRVVVGRVREEIEGLSDESTLDSETLTGYRYDGFLLKRAEDLAARLMPAFGTKTGIPFGTVNLMSGVPPGETDVASTAGAGSLVIEFGVLSTLTGKVEYGRAARRALFALFKRRSEIGLLGMHVNIQTGTWTETHSGIGSNMDSYYEYLMKAYVLFGDDAAYMAFLDTYLAAMKHLRRGPFFADVGMTTGKLVRSNFNNLQAFWPGMQVLLGDLLPAEMTLR